MEVVSPPDPNAMNLLEAQLREAYGRLVYTHKTQEKCADIKLGDFNRMRWAQTILSALTSTGFFVIVFGDASKSHATALLAGIASTLLVIANAYMQGTKAAEEAEKHRSTAGKLWPLREAYISLITDVRSKSIALEDAKQKRDELEGKLAEIYGSAPSTSDRAYKAAQKALKFNEELTFTDAEIDLLLPTALRKLPQIEQPEATDSKLKIETKQKAQ